MADAPAPLLFPCTSCGADLSFSPGAQALRCGYCGHTETIAQGEGEVAVHDFAAYDAQAQPRGFGTNVREVRCATCGAATHVAAHVTSTSCPFCGSSQVAAREGRADLVKPASLIPFAVTEDDVRARFRDWLGRLWFRPNALKSMAVATGVRGVYIPHWSFNALTISFWRAEAGYHYWLTEEVRVRGSDGQTRTETRRVQRTRWEPAHGRHEAYFRDVLVPASKGLNAKLARRLRFETRALVPYSPDFLAGFAAEDDQVGMRAAWPQAQTTMEGEIRRECARSVPGDTHRNLRVSTSYHNEKYKLCLLPIWIAGYRFNNKSYQYLCNGQTGEIAGEAPVSVAKVVAFVAALVAVAAALVALFGR